MRIIIGALVGLILIMQPFVMDPLLAFVFAGIIPGTNLELPFWAMSLLLACVGYIAIRWATKDPVYIGDTPHQEAQKKLAARKYVLQKINPTPKPSRRPTLRRRKRTYRVATS
jgi:hypothetical protein